LKYQELKQNDKNWVNHLWKENKEILGPPFPIYNYLKAKAPNEIFLVVPEIAFLHYRVRRDGETVLYNIAIDISAKRQGLGRKLVELMTPPIILKTDADNEESNQFYKRLGFICLGKKLTKSGKTVNIYKRF